MISLFLLTPLFACLSRAVSFPEYNFSAPIDHFHNESRYEPHSNGVFNLRYWFDSTHYRSGGPVFVIAAGEADGEERFPFLSQGIVTELAKTYNGLGVILEHRYYGKSYPSEHVTPENLRFLSTEQALADYAYFASNVVFPGLEDFDLTAASTPWIAYGGSYAGAMVAFLRKLYPAVFWGAVSSSGVTAAVVDYWNYYEPIRHYGPADCIDTIQTITDIVDRILIDHPDSHELHTRLQATFGVSPPIDNTDFVSRLSRPLDSFQSRNWDPAVGSYEFRHYCDNITHPTPLYQANNYTAQLPDLLGIAGYSPTDDTLLSALRNEIGYLNFSTEASPESKDNNTLPRTSTTSWNYQVCTEWGYFMPGSTVPSSIRPLLSRLIDLNYTSSFCAIDFGISTPPNVTEVNKHGGFHFSYPRVAIIGGAADPWRDATPHAEGLPPRKSTDSEPFILVDIPAEHVWDGIAGAVHHWDQNGLSEDELEDGKRPPREIKELQVEIARFVGEWLGEWQVENTGKVDLR
ncbi:serine carboxypeptidase S28-domain-containing protein [Aspergillus egyptiacus]|nr:serine carboxypeptidase S28-domain-containing protein [Aspergillus egyptiacus]